MLSFVLKHSPLKLCWVPGYSDYYLETIGGQGYRLIGWNPNRSTPEARPDEAGRAAYGKVPMNMVVLQQDYVRPPPARARHPRGGAAQCWLRSASARSGLNATGKNLV